jgi:hypothetical protein
MHTPIALWGVHRFSRDIGGRNRKLMRRWVFGIRLARRPLLKAGVQRVPKTLRESPLANC